MRQPNFGSVLQSTVVLDNDSLVQVQDWDGKEATIRRRLVDGKMVVVSALAFPHLPEKYPCACPKARKCPWLLFSYKSWKETFADNHIFLRIWNLFGLRRWSSKKNLKNSVCPHLPLTREHLCSQGFNTDRRLCSSAPRLAGFVTL